MPYKIFDLIENEEVFQYMLAGFFKDWPGTYDVLVAETGEYLINPVGEKNFQRFCQKVRHSSGGMDLCLNCDIRFSKEAASAGKPIHYICDLGLLDIAVPIMVDGELVATIFCGQRRSEDPVEEEIGKSLATEAEILLDLPPNTLTSLREDILPLSNSEMNREMETLWKMASYLSNVGHEKKILKMQLGEINEIREALEFVGGVIENLDIFWHRVSKMLERLNRIFGADQGLMVMQEYEARKNREFLSVKASAGVFNDSFSSLVIDETNLLNVQSPTILNVQDIIKDWKHLNNIVSVAIVPINLDADYSGFALFFTSNLHDIYSSLPIAKEINLLSNFSGRLATAYQNCRMHSLRREWLKILSHQIIAPVNGIQGHAENIKRWIGNSTMDLPTHENPIFNPELPDDKRITIEIPAKRLRNTVNTTESILWMSRNVSQLARNFAWLADIEKEKNLSAAKPYFGLVPLLISCARNAQGLAREQGIRRVHVEEESVKQLEGKLRLDKDLFVQVIGNLLDNAIKYSDLKTEIIINASQTREHGSLRITNRGIPIHPVETELVFQQEYRTEDAKARHATGMGIGLTIARSIIYLHGGNISVEPSRKIEEPEYKGYETTFKITFPLITT